ncbi:MAG TPA: sulfite exporter TauE/SafE family protein [Thermoleophilaceae bacterium]
MTRVRALRVIGFVPRFERTWRRSVAAALTVMAVALALVAPSAMAHPLGNFSINHLSTVRISADRVDVHYVLDQAEIPTLQERGLSDAQLLRRKRREIDRRLRLTVDGRRTPLEPAGRSRLSFPAGAGGLRTTRLELELRASVDDPRRVRLYDGTFDGRVGWKAIVAAAGEGTAVRTSTPSGDPTDGLRRYPQDLQSSPLDRRDASFRVRPGAGTLSAPKGEGQEVSTSRAEGGEGFTGLFEDAAAGEGVLVLLLLAAFGWGALHALSPGHGKAMVAAYLVGTRGTARHAVALGATVTVTHTIGVFALGLVTLALSQYVLPEDLYPWLTLVSGLMVVGVGAAVLRSRLRRTHDHHHHHHHPEQLGWRGIVGMGAAAGLIPCPSALVVLLAAISQHEVALGLLLIVAFSLGLAGTLTVLGLAVVSARRLIPPRLATGKVMTALPAASALLIVGVGCVLTAKAVPGLS